LSSQWRSGSHDEWRMATAKQLHLAHKDNSHLLVSYKTTLLQQQRTTHYVKRTYIFHEYELVSAYLDDRQGWWLLAIHNLSTRKCC
jgi:hypothetical protein